MGNQREPKNHQASPDRAKTTSDYGSGEHEGKDTLSALGSVTPILMRKSSCACGGGCPACRTHVDGLKVSNPADSAEVDADTIADRVMKMKERSRGPRNNGVPSIQRQSNGNGGGKSVGHDITGRINSSSGGGVGLDGQTLQFMQHRFGTDLGGVRIHTGGEASALNRGLAATAFTVGKDIYFGEGRYRPDTEDGKRLIAHELVHVQQQREQPSQIQRTLGDGHDLTSPRFSRLIDLEAAYDGEDAVETGDRGRGVQAIQQALYDLGIALPTAGADGTFDSETQAAVHEFQVQNPPLVQDGRVGAATMTALDARFASPTLPPVADRSAPWTPSCVQAILCPWSPHTVEVLRTRIRLVAYDSITWEDEEWDGASWVPAPFIGGGYNNGTDIGVLNSSCERMAETLYHEVLHAEQPTLHTTTRQREEYAYRIGEEFSIAMGLGGRPALRRTDARGREFASRPAVRSFVASQYPGVPTGAPREEILRRAAGVGQVEVRRPDGSIYTRPAAVGEKVPGPRVTVPDPGAFHSTIGWTCP